MSMGDRLLRIGRFSCIWGLLFGYAVGYWTGNEWAGVMMFPVSVIVAILLEVGSASSFRERNHQHVFQRENIADYYPLEDRVGRFVRYEHWILRCECGERKEYGTLWIGGSSFDGKWVPLPKRQDKDRV